MRPFSQPLIFVVDSNRLYQKLIIQYFDLVDLTVILTFTSTEECLRFIDLKPDIIITELYFGNEKTDGIDLLKKIRILSPSTKVIFLSLSRDMEAAVKSVRLGAVDFIIKNKTSLDKLLWRINQLISYRDEVKKVNITSIKIAASIAVILAIFISLIFLHNKW
jgi:DNA-binding NtrC family response regulator